MRTDSWQRLPGSYHGSGCTLASAIAAMLANGLELPEAVREAQDYTWHALQKAYRPGMGQFLPDRLFWAREDDAEPRVDDDVAAGVARCCSDTEQHRWPRHARAAPRSQLAGLYAVTPDLADTAALSARTDARAGRRRVGDPVPQQGRVGRAASCEQAVALARAVRGARRALHRQRRRRARARGRRRRRAPRARRRERRRGARAARAATRSIGVSCYDDLARARGGGRRRRRLRRVRQFLSRRGEAGRAARRPRAADRRGEARCGVPVVAIGGITAANARAADRRGRRRAWR